MSSTVASNTTTDLTGKIIIKAEHNGVIRKVPILNNEITYDELILMVQRLFGLSASDTIELKYRDEENDLVSLLDNGDLSFALQCSRMLKLKVNVVGKLEKNNNAKLMTAAERKAIRDDLVDSANTGNKTNSPNSVESDLTEKRSIASCVIPDDDKNDDRFCFDDDFCDLSTMVQKKKAVLLGVFENPDNKDAYILTPNASKINASSNGSLEKNIDKIGPIKKGKVRIFYGITPDLPVVAVVGLGPNNAGFNELEELDEKNENIRAAIASGVRSLRDLGAIDEIDIDSCDNAACAAEGAALGLYHYDELKSSSLKKPVIKFNLLANEASDEQKWNIGLDLANGQNLCRYLKETPANIMTPAHFAKIASEKLGKFGVQVIARDRAWAESMKMGSFLSVANGSDEPPVFLEMHYNNALGTKPVVFVGMGITFDSGAISLKPSSNMDKMRADMGGAANVLSTIYTLATMKAPVNIIGLTPLAKNLPSGKATKPGDTVVAMNGKSIQIDNTDAEGRLVLADALVYAHQFDPLLILDIATLTGAMNVALGSEATGVITTTTKYWNLLNKCGGETGDRTWRMPLFQHYTKQVADLNNIGKYAGQGGCYIAAAFLREFVTHPNWLHLEIAGVMNNKDEVPYLSKGMSGRPMRTLVKFVEKIYSEKVF